MCAGFVLDQSAGFIFDHDGQHVNDECNQGEGKPWAIKLLIQRH